MPKYRLLVRTQMPDQTIAEPDSIIDWEGEPRWQFEPLDPAERAMWETETFDQAKYDRTPDRHRVPLSEEYQFFSPPPPSSVSVPTSGWQGGE